MAKVSVRRAGGLRRDRRSGPQNDLPGALCDGEARRAQGSGDRRCFPKWSLERLHRRVTDSIKRAGGIDDKRALQTPSVSAQVCERRLCRQQYIHGDQRGAGECAAACALSGNSASLFETVIKGLGAANLAGMRA
jgi:hypothetical protein